jgi:hypothetical protein
MLKSTPLSRRSLAMPTMTRPVLACLATALFIAVPAMAQHGSIHNESCSHDEGTCRPPQHVTTGLPSLLVDSDQALLGHIEKDFQSAAMRPASFPSFLPSDALGAGSVINLPQPRLFRAGPEEGTPLSKGAATAGTIEALGLF